MKIAATLTASELRETLKDSLQSVQDDQVLQVIHRGQPIRLVVTQEHYLDLLQKASLVRPATEMVSIPAPTLESREKRLKDRLHAKKRA
jgi:hypothetical protein